MDNIFNCIDSKDLRRHLRRDRPPCERILWLRLRGRQAGGLKFRRQHGIGPYVVDLYCAEVKLAVEIDGYSHTFEDTWANDCERQRFMESLGVKVVRFASAQIWDDIESVIEQIVAAADRDNRSHRTRDLPPTPSSGQEGESEFPSGIS